MEKRKEINVDSTDENSDWIKHVEKLNEEGNKKHEIKGSLKEITNKIVDKAVCQECEAEEGQLHLWGCGNEKCPFCGGQRVSCGCFNDLMDSTLQPGISIRHPCLTAKHKKRWLDIIGNLKSDWKYWDESKIDTWDFIIEQIPDWCKTKEELRHFEKERKKFWKLDIQLDYKWESFCIIEGRIPFVDIPNICTCCGATWPEMFDVPDTEWEKYVIPEFQQEMLCVDCFEQQKKRFPEGWRKTQYEIQKQDKSKKAWAKCLREQGIIPVCRVCGTRETAIAKICPVDSAKYLIPKLKKEVMCTSCFERMKTLFPKGWKKAKKWKTAKDRKTIKTIWDLP